MTWPNDSRSNGAVTIRVFDPGTGWSLAEAREMLTQGYSAEHVARVTGYPERMIAIGAAQDVAG
ncbi:MAG TPA: hypothetical protein VLR26_02470 [Frankiaceae bacterium]|nr:hypothetical protein [Frankiaceae bacterium]